MLKKRNQKGFTLIEIIAVLVILGILAAVAIPKYFDIQGDARGKAMQGAIAALQSTVTQEYAKGLLNGSYNATTGPAANSVTVGDFSGGWSGVSAGNVTVTVTGGPSGWNDAPTSYNRAKEFKMM
jgi:prepilin-type N-terminal cleavage/methylation domain-containing protein